MAIESSLAGQKASSMIPHVSPLWANHKRIYLWSLLLTDALMLILAFTVAYWLRFYGGLAIARDVLPSADLYARLVLLLVPAWLFLFATVGLYNFRHLLGGTTEYARAFHACTSGMMLVVLLSFIYENFVIARGWLVMSWLFAGLFVCLGRFTLRRVAYWLRQSKGFFVSSALVIGTNQEAIALASQLRKSDYSGLMIHGFIDVGNRAGDTYIYEAGRGQQMNILGKLEALPELVRQRKISEVIIATTALSREQLLAVFETLTTFPDVEMRLSSGLYEAITTNMEVQLMGSVPLMSLNRFRLDPIENALKRILDCSLILIASVTLLPLFIIIALAIKLDSPGPVLYRRRVLGVGGKQFDAFKFRTMVVNGDEVLDQHPELKQELLRNHKLKDDPRITRVGRLLRATSLDELPQILNVLFGQMSLVGPRMISPQEAKEYGIYSSNLLTVRPGITGLWQVSGRSDISYEERVQLDMHYIRNYSIWSDLQILFVQTLPAVLRRDGAY